MVLTAVRQSPPKPAIEAGGSRRPPVPDSRPTIDRTEWLARARKLDAEARQAAEAGDIESSAQKILAALDCERRAGTVGPQVLQLIKPPPVIDSGPPALYRNTGAPSMCMNPDARNSSGKYRPFGLRGGPNRAICLLKQVLF